VRLLWEAVSQLLFVFLLLMLRFAVLSLATVANSCSPHRTGQRQQRNDLRALDEIYVTPSSTQ
jgi:hypothetical protein